MQRSGVPPEARRREPRFPGARFVLAAITAAASVLAILVGLPSAVGAVTQIPANYFSVIDEQGANDVNAAQVDLTQLGRDDTDSTVYKLFWSWDATSVWTGTGQTGDACALFDGDGDGNVDFAVCGQIENPGANPALVTQTAGSPFVFSCSDAKDDRCAQPDGPLPFTASDVKAGALTSGDPEASPPASLITETDPFDNLLADQEWPADSTLEVVISKAFLGTYMPAGSVLVNVCSYPSAGNGGNNNPFDCIVTPGGGFLEIVKAATPSDTTQDFSFTADGKQYSITGSGSTAPIPLPIGDEHSVAETVPDGWQLDSAGCVLSGGGSTGAKSGATVSGIVVESGKLTTCTFTDSVKTGSLVVKKAVVDDSGGSATPGAWSIHVKSGSTEVAGSPQPGSATGTTYTLPPGSYVVSETGGPSGYTLAGFSGDCDSGGTVTVVAGESKTCTLTNDDQAAHLKLVKKVTNDNGGKAVAGDFTLSAAGPTPVSGAGGVDKDVSAGTYALSESGPAGYAASAWVCVGGTQSGSSVTLAVGQSATCTVTNDDVAPKLHLRKIVVDNDGGTKTAADFRLTADGTGANDLSGVTPVDSGPALVADTWTLSETSADGYSASAWVCVGGTQSTNHITLGVGGEATCTITNDDVAPSPGPSPTPTPSPAPEVVTHPGISVAKSPDEQAVARGAAATWTIVVRNTGDVTLTGITVGDALSPGCVRTSATLPALAAMAPNASATYTCTKANVTAGFTNVAVATGKPPTGADVTASDSAHVTVTKPFVPPKPVQHPAIAVTKSPSSQTVSAGGTATFTITVTNNGDVALHDVTVTDPKSPGCNRDVGTLAPGAKRTYTCTRPGVTKSFLNRVDAVGTSPAGGKVRSTDVAPVKAAPFVPPAAPSIRISKSPEEQTVEAGGKATFRITVTNTGNVALHAVAVTDSGSPGCRRSIGTLKPGASRTYTCSQPGVKAPYTNIAQAKGTSPAGKTVRDQDSARVGTVAVKPAFTG